MSRAKGQSHVYAVANDMHSAAERLVWEWAQERRQSWAIDRKPDPRPMLSAGASSSVKKTITCVPS